MPKCKEFQYVRIVFDTSTGTMIVVEDCGVLRRASPEAVSLYAHPFVTGEALSDAAARKGGYILMMKNPGAKVDDIVSLNDDDPPLGIIVSGPDYDEYDEDDDEDQQWDEDLNPEEPL